MSNVSYAPAGETPSQLWNERANFVATNLNSWAYGILVALTIICLNELFSNRRRLTKGRWYFNVTFVSFIFVLGTIGGAINILLDQNAFIDDRDFPGGPGGYLTAFFNTHANILAFSCFVIATWLQDGYLLYRFLMFYSFKYYLCIFPALMYLGSVATSCVLLFQLSQPNANIWKSVDVNFATPYWSLSIALNIILTMMIVGRILWVKRSIRQALGDQHTRTYTSIAAMLIESAAMYSATALVYIICYALNSPAQELFLALLGEFQCISPVMIIYRVAKGSSLSQETIALAQSRSIAFAKGQRPPSKSTGIPSTSVLTSTIPYGIDTSLATGYPSHGENTSSNFDPQDK